MKLMMVIGYLMLDEKGCWIFDIGCLFQGDDCCLKFDNVGRLIIGVG